MYIYTYKREDKTYPGLLFLFFPAAADPLIAEPRSRDARSLLDLSQPVTREGPSAVRVSTLKFPTGALWPLRGGMGTEGVEVSAVLPVEAEVAWDSIHHRPVPFHPLENP